MRTEAELIYTIWDIVRGGEFNSDDPINERLMRQFLRAHRGKLLNQTYLKGHLIPDEAFQYLGLISFTQLDNLWESTVLPKTIRFERGNYGLMINKDGFNISIMNSEEFQNSSKDRYNKFHPRMKYINNKLTFNIGLEQYACGNPESLVNTELNTVVRKLKLESLSQSIKVSAQAVLVNPDDEPGYDFTSSPYPMPDELIESLMNSVNAREFNIFLRTKSDETGDLRNNQSEHNTREEL